MTLGLFPKLDLRPESNEILGYMLDHEEAKNEKQLTEAKEVKKETDFITRDKLVYAKPDLVVIRDEEVVIYDFKSGKLSNDKGETKENISYSCITMREFF